MTSWKGARESTAQGVLEGEEGWASSRWRSRRADLRDLLSSCRGQLEEDAEEIEVEGGQLEDDAEGSEVEEVEVVLWRKSKAALRNRFCSRILSGLDWVTLGRAIGQHTTCQKRRWC